jgi:carbamate kinase
VIAHGNGPQVQADCDFARHTGKTAVIGPLSDIEAIVQSKALAIPGFVLSTIYGKADP